MFDHIFCFQFYSLRITILVVLSKLLYIHIYIKNLLFFDKAVDKIINIIRNPCIYTYKKNKHSRYKSQYNYKQANSYIQLLFRIKLLALLEHDSPCIVTCSSDSFQYFTSLCSFILYL